MCNFRLYIPAKAGLISDCFERVWNSLINRVERFLRWQRRFSTPIFFIADEKASTNPSKSLVCWPSLFSTNLHWKYSWHNQQSYSSEFFRKWIIRLNLFLAICWLKRQLDINLLPECSLFCLQIVPGTVDKLQGSRFGCQAFLRVKPLFRSNRW
jgi:hypothetical protein